MDDDDAEDSFAAVSPANQVAALSAFMDTHYRRWLEVPLPALGGVTPRRAARDKRLRHRLVGQVKNLENREVSMAMAAGRPAYRTDWIWQELGLEEESA